MLVTTAHRLYSQYSCGPEMKHQTRGSSFVAVEEPRIFGLLWYFYLAAAAAGSCIEKQNPMAIEAWFMEESDEDQRLPNHKNPKEFVSETELAEIGVVYWHLDPKDHENNEELKKIRESRGYNYMDILDLHPERVENYEEKLKNFYREHIHADEEIRYCLEGSGYFDVRAKDDRWIRIWIKEGDLIILPAGIYHRFTLDNSNYVKLMRLFIGEPVWTCYNRPQDDHPSRQRYIKNFVEKSGIALEAH